MIKENDWMTLRELEEELKIKYSTVMAMEKNGLKRYKLHPTSRKFYYKRSEVDAYINNQKGTVE